MNLEFYSKYEYEFGANTNTDIYMLIEYGYEYWRERKSTIVRISEYIDWRILLYIVPFQYPVFCRELFAYYNMLEYSSHSGTFAVILNEFSRQSVG